jgi:magnesium transporter
VNQSVARLTAVSTIFLPLTFITGIYGMNFEYMPETQWEYGFYAILGLCMLLGISMLNYLRRKKII